MTDEHPEFESEVFNSFLLWERASKDTIDFKKIYVDMCGDLIAGLLLSQIVYWYLPGKDGQSKIRVHRKNKEWIAKERTEWWDEIRISGKQFDRAVKILEKLNIVETAIFHFDGSPTKHLRVNKEVFLLLWQNVLEDHNLLSNLPKGQIINYPKGKMDIPQRSIPYTENTTESEEKDITPNGAEPKPAPKKRKANPWYDVVFEVWGFVNSRNGAYQKMLQGKATDVTHKPGNIEPSMEPEEVRKFAAWYRREKSTDMVSAPIKVQSYVAEYRRYVAAQFVPPQDYVAPEVEDLSGDYYNYSGVQSHD